MTEQPPELPEHGNDTRRTPVIAATALGLAAIAIGLAFKKSRHEQPDPPAPSDVPPEEPASGNS